MAKIISGKEVSASVRAQVKKECDELKAKGIAPGLAVIIVGDDPASRVYVNNKKKACADVGFVSEEYALPASTTLTELLKLIDELNVKKEINGILCQLPLPEHLDEKAVINAISPLKDVDAFHPSNVGKIMIGDYHFLPCTPAGVMEMIHTEGIDVNGKNCVVIGRSNIVGKPMAMLLLHENGTVTICHSRTKNLKEICAQADILVAAVGRPKAQVPSRQRSTYMADSRACPGRMRTTIRTRQVRSPTQSGASSARSPRSSPESTCRARGRRPPR